MIINRRKLVSGLAFLIAAPAIVRVTNLMPVKSWAESEFQLFASYDGATWIEYSFNDPVSVGAGPGWINVEWPWEPRN